jgi:hypothetical protein
MPNKNITKKEITILITEHAISLMQDAMKNNETTLQFRNSLYEKYDTSIVFRGDLFHQFYINLKPWYGNYLDEHEFNDPESVWPFYIDQMTTGCIEEFVPKELNAKFQDLKQELFDKLCEIGKDAKYRDLYELMFTEFNNDLFYAAALSLLQDHPELQPI